jgi:type I restriction-modification system DNA methylase subunit
VICRHATYLATLGAPVNDPNLSSFIWSVADLLRGDYKQSEYGKVILPFTVVRRLDCVLEACRSRKPRRPTGSTPKGPVSDALRSEGERVQAANSV